MIAHERTVEEIAEHLGADSLAYLSLDGVYEAVGTPREKHCDACFTGDYPLGDRGRNGKFALEEIAVIPASASFRAVTGAFRIAVLASGGGTNLQAILDTLHGQGEIEVVAVGSDKPEAKALERAAAGRGRDRRLPVAATTTTGWPRPRDADWLEDSGVDLVVLAGYMQLLSAGFIARFPQPDRERASRPAPVVPGPRRGRPGPCPRCADHRGHGPLRRRGRRLRPILLQRPVPVPRAATGTSSRTRSTGPSTRCCPRRSR